MAYRTPHFLSGSTSTPADRLQHAIVAVQADNLGLRHDLDVGEARDSVDEIARHARLKIWSSNDEPDLGNLACQIDHRLARRIAAAYECHLLPGAQLCLQRRSPIVH